MGHAGAMREGGGLVAASCDANVPGAVDETARGELVAPGRACMFPLRVKATGGLRAAAPEGGRPSKH